MKRVYPVIFTQTKDCILAEVPGLGVFTEAPDLSDAIDMVRNVMGLKAIALENEGVKIPEPSLEVDINKSEFIKEGNQIISYVDIDFEAFKRKFSNKAVRRNVTLPSWLNERADEEDLNVSKVLQEALLEKLCNKEVSEEQGMSKVKTTGEAFAEKWLKENGFEFAILRQYNSKTKYKITKDGITDELELPYDVVDYKKYMESFNESFKMKVEIILLRKQLQE